VRKRICVTVAAAAALAAGVVSVAPSDESHAATLFSNGPLITEPNGGTGAIAGQPLSRADSFPLTPTLNGATTGVGATHSLGVAVAENFVVPAWGWDLDSVTVYAFQTSQTTPTVTDVYINLWTSAPYSADSPPPRPEPLPAPLLSTPLHLAAGPGSFVAHRVSGSSTSTVRPIFAYTVSLNGLPNAGVLGPGEYWLEWSMDGATSPSVNVFVPLVSPRTAAYDLNARLYNIPLAGMPLCWFEGREGYQNEANPGRPYALAFELHGTELPEPAAGVMVVAATLLITRRRTRTWPRGS
jgi:hypothetical protein